MATWDDVRGLVAALPDTDEHPSYDARPAWRVHHKAFVWDRPLTATDRAALGQASPVEGEAVLGVRVTDEGVKAALIADEPAVFFTIPHFDGHAVVLLRLSQVSTDVLAEVVEDAWRARAPRRLIAEFDQLRSRH